VTKPWISVGSMMAKIFRSKGQRFGIPTSEREGSDVAQLAVSEIEGFFKVVERSLSVLTLK